MSTFHISPVQKRIFRHSREKQLFHHALFRINVPVAHDLVQRWRQLVNKHSILRTTFTYNNNVLLPFQEITTADHTTVKVITADEKDIADNWNMFTKEESDAIRLIIFQTTEEQPVYFGIVSPAVYLDSWSLRYLAQQLITTAGINAESPEFVQYVEWLEQLSPPDEGLPAGLEAAWTTGTGACTLTLEEGHAGGQTYITQEVILPDDLLTELNAIALKMDLRPCDIWYWAWTNLLALYQEQEQGSHLLVSSGRSFEEFREIPGPFAKAITYHIRKEQQQDILSLKEQRESLEVYREYFNPEGMPAHSCSFEYLERIHFPETVMKEMPACIDSLSVNEPFVLSFFAEERVDTTRVILQANEQAISAVSLAWISHTLLQYIKAFAEQEGDAINIPVLLTPDAEKKILDELVFGTDILYDKETLTDIFIDTVTRFPESNAVIWGQGSMTYRELFFRARQLSETLMEQFDISPGDRVVVHVSRTEKVVPLIWGIIFSGATYIPADKQYPEERIRYILEQSDAKLLITDSTMDTMLKKVSMDQLLAESAVISLSRSLPVCGADHPVYILYTSGTTGLPKGCVITMDNLLHYTRWANSYYFNDAAEGVMPLFTTLAFDLTVTSFFCTLMRGAALYVFGEQDYINQLISDSFKGLSGIDTIKLTPSHIRILPYLDVHTTHINTCIVGGEALLESDVKILRALNPGMNIYNEYGPTECTVGCIVWKVPETFHTILVGKPISNTSAFIFNTDMELCSPGIEGEIYISGKTVGAGYFRDDEKTAARFIPVAGTSSKLYRTGDKGYWMPDGNIRYTGRNDQMIKIRGYRIEPGEIAAVIRQVAGVNDAFVMACMNADNELELVGYYEGTQLLTDKIQAQLNIHLPVYMHPPHLIALEKFPLNVNGKLDMAALPSPEEVRGRMHHYVAPQKKLEKLLAGVWETVMKRTQIGIHDHFLSIGGDSIKAIQVVARMRDIGWKLQVGDILRCSTIASLVNYLQENDPHPEADAAITGEVPLTPLQIKFFNDNITQPHYYNQSILLDAGERVNEDRLKRAILKLWHSHAMLRATFPITDNVRTLKILPADMPGNDCFLVLSSVDEQVEEKMRYWQARFDLESGPLFRCLLFRDGEKDMIFLLAHHLIIDGVSWRILLEQLSRLYLMTNPEDLQLSATGSYYQWSVALKQRVQQISVAEQDYWEKMSESIKDEWPAERHIEKTFRHYELRSGVLSAEKTGQLLHMNLHGMGISIEEILLSCLSETICRWNGMDEITCYLESHGRSSTGDAAVFAETIGWFTMKYPIRLSGMPDADVAGNIQQTIHAMEQIPGNGEGYLCLKYLKEENVLKNGNEPFFTFNYLGQGDTLDNTPFSIHQISSFQQDIGGEIYMPSAVFFTLIITDGVLCIDISYHQGVYTRSAIEELLQLYILTLERYITELRSDTYSFKRTLSGIDTQGLNARELDEILNSI
ncbi:non-ribosomal peptide synthetase [[Flexibacter] sp. ATCC 35208]|uniref:non-ribosomal peptide synthetase n=1 Tax=[Flexibacter] sp. ATCC 35208 TaxID=1936242 RepID=UPI0009D34070|nr:non-ribosomal peptide synthetase [[Flexibacter] sp. ATCC 35208]OMP79230.1 hypothetical protein BW716_10240 [[Flexibacter] sp. ATCC 35208]